MPKFTAQSILQIDEAADIEEKPPAIERFPTLVIARKGEHRIEAKLVRECHLAIVLNGKKLGSFICTPRHLEYLALGFLFSEGLISCKESAKSILVNHEQGTIRVETINNKAIAMAAFSRQDTALNGTSGTGTHKDRIPDSRLTAADIFTLAEAFQHISPIYQATHGAHSAALCSGNKIIVWAEDIGRHNAVDKVLGQCLFQDIPTRGRVLFSSGRIASDVVHKAVKIEVSAILSLAAPTNMAINLANKNSISIIGSVKNDQMTIFTNEEMVER